MLEFLTELYGLGLQYSALNTARSALSCVLYQGRSTIGTDPLITRFMKGVFQTRPVKCKYKSVWDVNIVLSFIEKLGDNSGLSLKNLTLKLAMLVALTSAQRCQSVHNLNLENMNVIGEKYVFSLGQIKQTRPNAHSFFMELMPYRDNPSLCVVLTLKEYLARTEKFRNDEKSLFISYFKPHHKVGRDTISRWIKTVLQQCGISTFGSHSTRAASTSKALSSCVPIQEILKRAGWSSSKTSAKHYHLPSDDTSEDNFVKAVLKKT